MAVVVRLVQAQIEQMVAHALRDAPVECCGIIAERDGRVAAIYEMRNAEESPYRFMMDPLEQRKVEQAIDDSGAKLAGFYHSHTGSEARPSMTDIRMMGPLFGPPFFHFVVGVGEPDAPVVRVFHIIEDRYEEQEYEVVADPA